MRNPDYYGLAGYLKPKCLDNGGFVMPIFVNQGKFYIQRWATTTTPWSIKIYKIDIDYFLSINKEFEFYEKDDNPTIYGLRGSKFYGFLDNNNNLTVATGKNLYDIRHNFNNYSEYADVFESMLNSKWS